jgi:hypothetical protein
MRPRTAIVVLRRPRTTFVVVMLPGSAIVIAGRPGTVVEIAGLWPAVVVHRRRGSSILQWRLSARC